MFPEIWVWLGHTQFNALVSYSSLLWWLFLHKKILETNQFLSGGIDYKKTCNPIGREQFEHLSIELKKKNFPAPI